MRRPRKGVVLTLIAAIAGAIAAGVAIARARRRTDAAEPEQTAPAQPQERREEGEI